MKLAPPLAEAPMVPLENPGLCESRTLGDPAGSICAGEAEAARAWLEANVNVYVLNLPDDKDRLQFMTARLAQLGIRFLRVPGIDMSLPGAYRQARRTGLVAPGFNFTLAQANAEMPLQSMGGIVGTVGCAAAHLRALAFAEAQGNTSGKPLALVLEDDVDLVDDFAVKLRRLVSSEVPCDWLALSLRTMCPYGRCVSPHLTRVLPDGNEPADRCRHGVNYGFYAMLYPVRTLPELRRRLAKAVWNDWRPHCLDIDVALASISDEVPYYAVPAVQSPGFLSTGHKASSRGQINMAWIDDAEGDKDAPAVPLTDVVGGLVKEVKGMLHS